MARPTKQGIDYFPLDVQFDDKVELLVVECGAEGLGILITIWQLIYQNEGYYIAMNSDLALLIRRRVMSEIDPINRVINTALARGIFDQELYEKYKILTSKAIQKRFFMAAKKKKSVVAVKNYIYRGVSDAGNLVYSCGNATNTKYQIPNTKKKKLHSANAPKKRGALCTRFDDFWSCYPLKKNKKKCLEKWKARKLDEMADRIISDVKKRSKCERGWLEGFIPLPTTYINGDRWEDEIEYATASMGDKMLTPEEKRIIKLQNDLKDAE